MANVTIRIEENILNTIKTNFASAQAGLTLIIEPFDRLRMITIAELKGYFTREEIIALADSQNGTMLTPDYIYNKAFILAQLEDFQTFEGGISRHEADPETLINKVKNLSHSQVYYLLMHIHIFWNTNGSIEKLITSLI